jgi:hypothetical protein
MIFDILDTMGLIVDIRRNFQLFNMTIILIILFLCSLSSIYIKFFKKNTDDDKE